MIAPERAALVIIDMQRGFIDEASPLCIAGAAATVPACARALSAARAQGMTIVHAIRAYAADGSDVEATRYDAWTHGRPLSPAADDPASAEEPPELAPAPGDIVIVKPRFSAFFGTELDARLRAASISTVVLAGTTTPNCIRSTCYDALSLDYNVCVLNDCTSSRTPEVQRANIEDMAFIGATVMDCEAFEREGLANMEDAVARVRAAARRDPSPR